jgi:hypothetical protein
VQCISIDWYSETSALTLYAAMNAKKSPQKATDWSGTKSSELSKEIKPSWNQSLDKKHFWVHAKFECTLSIPFTIKKRSKIKDGQRKVLVPNRGLKSTVHGRKAFSKMVEYEIFGMTVCNSILSGLFLSLP